MTSSEDMKRLFWWMDNIEARVAALEALAEDCTADMLDRWADRAQRRREP